MPSGVLNRTVSRGSATDRQHVVEKDADRLAQIGYKQELKRDWGVLQNFGASFSIISTITGITTLFEFGLLNGGPGVMSVGWIIVSVMTMAVACGMAEIVSAVPCAGGPYFWAAVLSPPRWSPMMSWVVGYFNLLGQIAVTTGISFGGAGLIATLAAAHGFEATAAKTLGIYAAIMVSHGTINTLGVRTLRYFNNASIILHSLGVFSLIVAVLAKAPTHQSAKFVFATFYDGTAADGAEGWSQRASPAYVALLGILLTQYTITGFDASAHLCEETRNATWAAPIGVLMSVGCSAVFGFFVLVGLLFSIQDFDNTVDSSVGQPVLQILIDVFGLTGATVLMVLIIICVWHCGLFSIASNSRMAFSFARDSGLPKWFAHIDQRFHSPSRTIWLAVVLAFCLAIPSLGSSVAFAAATSIATIGLYISYTIPIISGVIWHKNFQKGPFDLGRFSRPVAIIATLWVAFIVIVFCLPQINPVDSQTLNYTPVAVGAVALWAFGSWFLWAKNWFQGPIRQIDLDHVGGVMGHSKHPGLEEDSIDKEAGDATTDPVDV